MWLNGHIGEAWDQKAIKLVHDRRKKPPLACAKSRPASTLLGLQVRIRFRVQPIGQAGWKWIIGKTDLFRESLRRGF